MENKFREKLEPKIREKSVHLRTFAFTKLDFGRKVSAISGRAAWAVSLSPARVTADGKDPTCTAQPLGLCLDPWLLGPSTICADLRKPRLAQSWGGKQFRIS